jgi:hypothetical protein
VKRSQSFKEGYFWCFNRFAPAVSRDKGGCIGISVLSEMLDCLK